MRRPLQRAIPILVPALFVAAAARADITIPMQLVDDAGGMKPAGQIVASESKYGTVFTPMLQGLPPGLHGFHIHENPSCATKDKDGKPVAALAAGGHFDPEKTGKHGLPWGDGHLGDLPPIYVDSSGMAMNPVLGPRVKLADLAGHSLMIHAGGDNHSDHPMPLGGGGARIACGVVP
jgi:Cu-Zn family superoxide dismutase